MTQFNRNDHTGAVSKYLELKVDTDNRVAALNITKAQMMKKSMDDIKICANENCDPWVVQKMLHQANKESKVDVLIDDINRQRQYHLRKLHSTRKEMIDEGVPGEYLPFRYSQFVGAGASNINSNEDSGAGDENELDINVKSNVGGEVKSLIVNSGVQGLIKSEVVCDDTRGNINGSDGYEHEHERKVDISVSKVAGVDKSESVEEKTAIINPVQGSIRREVVTGAGTGTGNCERKLIADEESNGSIIKTVASGDYENVELRVEIIHPNDINEMNKLLDCNEKCPSLGDVCFVARRITNYLLMLGFLSSIQRVYDRLSHYFQLCLIEKEIIFIKIYNKYGRNYYRGCIWRLKTKDNEKVLYAVAEANNRDNEDQAWMLVHTNQIVDSESIWWYFGNVLDFGVGVGGGGYSNGSECVPVSINGDIVTTVEELNRKILSHLPNEPKICEKSIDKHIISRLRLNIDKIFENLLAEEVSKKSDDLFRRMHLFGFGDRVEFCRFIVDELRRVIELIKEANRNELTNVLKRLFETQVYIDKYNGEIHREFVMLLEIPHPYPQCNFYLKLGVPFKNNNYRSNCINTPHITKENVNLRSDVSKNSFIKTMDHNHTSFYQECGFEQLRKQRLNGICIGRALAVGAGAVAVRASAAVTSPPTGNHAILRRCGSSGYQYQMQVAPPPQQQQQQQQQQHLQQPQLQRQSLMVQQGQYGQQFQLPPSILQQHGHAIGQVGRLKSMGESSGQGLTASIGMDSNGRGINIHISNASMAMANGKEYWHEQTTQMKEWLRLAGVGVAIEEKTEKESEMQVPPQFVSHFAQQSAPPLSQLHQLGQRVTQQVGIGQGLQGLQGLQRAQNVQNGGVRTIKSSGQTGKRFMGNRQSDKKLTAMSEDKDPFMWYQYFQIQKKLDVVQEEETDEETQSLISKVSTSNRSNSGGIGGVGKIEIEKKRTEAKAEKGGRNGAEVKSKDIISKVSRQKSTVPSVSRRKTLAVKNKGQ